MRDSRYGPSGAYASVIAKLFLGEDGSDIAIRMKGRHVYGAIEVMAPSLVLYELINVLKCKRFSGGEIKMALEAINGYGLHLSS